jgi:hypothetical protein
MGGGGSIFWKTREIGLSSYSKICTLWFDVKILFILSHPNSDSNLLIVRL